VKIYFPVIISISLCLVHLSAHANFCKKVVTERAQNEVRQLENTIKTLYPTISSSDYAEFIGNNDYNADLITCNRKRDSNGGKVEKEISASHHFPDNLKARSIKGKYWYYSTAPLAYAYDLRRESGEWVVRVPMRFHWPTARKTDMIDISMELVNTLADPALTAFCDEKNTVFDKNGKDVTRGYIPVNNPSAGVKGTDTVHVDEKACRVNRTLKVNGISILRHLRQYFADSLKSVWDRTGWFRIEPVLLDHGEGTASDIHAWEKDGIVWELRLNLDPSSRASYKRWTFKWNHMYTGVPSHVIAHEFGHKLGFGDEYGWGPKATHSQRDCNMKNNFASSRYIMCSQLASWKLMHNPYHGAKAVYVWLATRRYTIANELTCKTDTDCGDGFYCSKGTLTVGRNQCLALKPVGKACTRDAQCKTDRCVAGSCGAAHECLVDDDCGSNQFYCKTGLGDLDRNTCVVKLDDWKACTNDKQCKSGKCSGWRPQDGQISGICYTANSKSSGDTCKIDLECSTGACNSNKRCVCKQDSDCGNGNWCNQGIDLKENSCRSKLVKGTVCGVYGDIGVSRRCKSGKCSTQTGLGVPGVTTLYCQ